MLLILYGVAFVIAFAIVYLLGYFILRVFGMPNTWALCTAPVVSASLYALLSLLYCSVGLPCNVVTVAAIPCLIVLVIWYIRREKTIEISLPSISWNRIALYASVGLGAGIILFLSALPSLDAFAQAWDNAHHLNVMRAFANARSFDILNETAYLDNSELNPMPGSGFYPATWHAICAMVLQVTGFEGGLVENAVNMVFCSCVFPLSALALFTFLFEGENRPVLVGSVAVVSFPLFPWEMLSYGPLYPNLASLSCVPLMMWLFAHLISKDVSPLDRRKTAVLFLLGCIGITFLQPNSLFTMAVFLAPFCAQRLWTSDGVYVGKCFKILSEKGIYLSGRVFALLFCAFCFGLWCALYYSPFMASVIHSGVWVGEHVSFGDALVNVSTLSFINGFYPSSTQVFSAVLVALGIVYSFLNRRFIWMTIAYLLSCCILVASLAEVGFYNNFLPGFWYGDPFRCGAIASVAAMPLVVLGMTMVLSLLSRAAKRMSEGYAERMNNALIPVVIISFVVVTFSPFSGLNNGLLSVRDVTEKWFAFERGPYSEYEMHFVKKAVDAIGTDAVVVNMPYDGSVVSYGVNGLNTYYRHFTGYGVGEETTDSIIIRNYLHKAAEDVDAQNALRRIGAEYVLKLRCDNASESFYGEVYWKRIWQSFDRLNDNTPGFEVVLAQDDMRLYRITCL